MAYHLGLVSKPFQIGELDEDMVENVDETHFLVSMDNGRSFSFLSCEEVKYADVSSGGEGMKLMVRNKGGKIPLSIRLLLFFRTRLGTIPFEVFQMMCSEFCTGMGRRDGWTRGFFRNGSPSHVPYLRMPLVENGQSS